MYPARVAVHQARELLKSSGKGGFKIYLVKEVFEII